MTIDPPTEKMGHGNVYLTLGLTQEQLNQYGIQQPNASQFEASLLGKSIITSTGEPVEVELQGILKMREDGLGWGQIAQRLGVKLGTVNSNLKSNKINSNPSMQGANAGVTTFSRGEKNTGVIAKTKDAELKNNYSHGPNGKNTEKGIVSATGDSLSGNLHGHSKNGNLGKGIVSGAGETHSVVSVPKGNAYGHSITSGSGGQSSASFSSSGKGNGQAKGHFK